MLEAGMPLVFDMDSSVGVFSSEGDVEFEEGSRVLANGLDQLVDEGLHRVVFDIRRSNETRSPDEVRAIADIVKSRIAVGRMAVVASDDLYFGLGRMFQAFTASDGLEVGVFRDYDEAIQWMGGAGGEGV